MILAIIKGNAATAEKLIAATASAGALDVQVGGRGQRGGASGWRWLDEVKWEGLGGGADAGECA